MQLRGDCDETFLINGVKNGFNIIKPDCVLSDVFTSNHRSVRDASMHECIDALIQKEIDEGNYIVTRDKPTIVSALGAVPKKDGSYRLIHDCSLPEQGGLNYHSPIFEHYSYQSVDDAIRLLKPGYWIAKVDIASAYRAVCISEHSQQATGLQWTFSDGRAVYMYDRKLPFGSRAAPTIFHRLSQSIKRMMSRAGYDNIVVYQDDFVNISADYYDCLHVWLKLINLLLRLGFRINMSKLVAPTTSLVFLGVQLCTIKCQISLPAEKLEKTQECIAGFVRKKRATKHQLQVLSGKLHHCAKVVRGARPFLRRLLDAMCSLKHAHHKVRLRGPVREDLMWWDCFLQTFNGVAAFVDEDPITPILTDSCIASAGAFCDGDMFFTSWAADFPSFADTHINYKEAMIATLAVRRWAHLFCNRTVVIYSDNQCAVSVINKCSCRSPVLMDSIRHMFWASVKYNFVVKCVYMPGFKHGFADSISRLIEFEQFFNARKYINNWYMCHVNICNAFDYFHLLDHMSMSSLACILPQVMQWRKRSATSHVRYSSTEVLHTRSVQRLHIDAS